MGWAMEEAEDAYWSGAWRTVPSVSDPFGRGHKMSKPTPTGNKTADQLRAMIAEANAVLAKIENRPEPDGYDLVVIEVRFGPSLKVYSYAGIKMNGRWYLTGPVRAATWTQVCEYFEERNATIVSVIPAVRVTRDDLF